MLLKYAAKDTAMLRMGFKELCDENRGVDPQFCRFNSGAPRQYKGRPSPRGPNTFLKADEWHGRPSEVVEVSFSSSVRLPKTCEVLESGSHWERLWPGGTWPRHSGVSYALRGRGGT
jgi:hypothetical protein